MSHAWEHLGLGPLLSAGILRRVFGRILTRVELFRCIWACELMCVVANDSEQLAFGGRVGGVCWPGP